MNDSSADSPSVRCPTGKNEASDERRYHRARPPQVWLLSDGNTGDEGQLTALAKALGWPYTLKPSRPGLARVLAQRLFGVRRLEGGGQKSTPFAPPWPDIVIIAGGRNVSIARHIRELSGGRTRLIQIGRPWGALDWFDLVITTPQYRLPERSNVLHNTAPLNRVQGIARHNTDERLRQRLQDLPRPRIGVFVGGSSGSYRFNACAARRMAMRLEALASEYRGSLMITTSARTSARAADALFAGIRAPGHCYRWRPDDSENPYLAYLAAADMFVVTGDSASMLADACGTGKDVQLCEIPQRLRSRLLTSVADCLHSAPESGYAMMRPLRRGYNRLVEKGLLSPPRDLRCYHEALRSCGLLRGERDAPQRERHEPLTDLSRAVERARALVPDDVVTQHSGGARRSHTGSGTFL